MLWFIIFITVFIFCLSMGIFFTILGRNTYRYEDAASGFWTGTVLSALILICLCLSLINLDAHFNQKIYEYESLKANVEAYEPGDYGNTGTIVEDVLGMNRLIANHKAHAESIWTGLWHSKEIGDLEPIVLPLKKTNADGGKY